MRCPFLFTWFFIVTWNETIETSSIKRFPLVVTVSRVLLEVLARGFKLFSAWLKWFNAMVCTRQSFRASVWLEVMRKSGIDYSQNLVRILRIYCVFNLTSVPLKHCKSSNLIYLWFEIERLDSPNNNYGTFRNPKSRGKWNRSETFSPSQDILFVVWFAAGALTLQPQSYWKPGGTMRTITPTLISVFRYMIQEN